MVAQALALVIFLLLGSAGRAMAQTPHLAQLRIIHASYGTPSLDAYVGGKKLIANLGFKGVSPALAVPAGSQSIQLDASGRINSLIDTSLNLNSGKAYSVVIMGTGADLMARVLEDDLSTLDPGKARLRVVHTSPDTPAVDVALKGGSVLFPNLGLGDASNYLTLNASTVDVELRPAGTTNVALDVPNLKLEAGKVYSAYGVGSSTGAPQLSVLTVADTAGSLSITPRVSEVMPLTGAHAGVNPDALPIFFGFIVLILAISLGACGASFRLLDFGYLSLDESLWNRNAAPRNRSWRVAVRWIKGVVRKA